MSRLALLILPLLLASACSAPTPQTAQVGAPASFNIPMDPGAIPCSALGNSAALNAAVEWSLGQARAALLSGAQTSVPDAQQMANALSAACASNPSLTVRGALR